MGIITALTALSLGVSQVRLIDEAALIGLMYLTPRNINRQDSNRVESSWCIVTMPLSIPCSNALGEKLTLGS